ncbi:MAG: hypothetical protein ACJA1A_001933 [Saprospiraceae bacterium]|jgi:hypothetical protein|tara:strand:- start:1300 stop:1569 length:270 start_codon:yes stop_codon:yes gene_type:complete
MNPEKRKYNLPVISAEMFNLRPGRYEIRKGTFPDAPPCPFGHRFKWIGYDMEEMKYVRVTKSVFKRLIADLDEDVVAKYESDFDEQLNR